MSTILRSVTYLDEKVSYCYYCKEKTTFQKIGKKWECTECDHEEGTKPCLATMEQN
jgi:hypothetical protein